jgi:hypothetical protein
MPSVVASAFHARVAASLPDYDRPVLQEPVGSAAPGREMTRAILLANRTIRRWASEAIGRARPDEPNSFERLPKIDTLGLAQSLLPTAVNTERRASARSLDAQQVLLPDAVDALAGAVADLDDLSAQPDTEALAAVGDAAGRVLACSDAFVGGSATMLDEANQTLQDLIASEGVLARDG